MNAYLCGMMGSGKSALGQRAASELGLSFLDLDREADRRLGFSFHELVRQKGWLAFRELEYRIVRRTAAQGGILFALGGGTVRYPWNLDQLKGTGPIILLNAPLEILAQRIRNNQRPRVTGHPILEDELAAIWENSREAYLSACDEVFETHPGSLEKSALGLSRLIADLMKRQTG
ncbi:shikimate kinase [Dethiosulfatarculus sandiegensis]|uniref:Shikimate kinase n=1 Tax=Dethiosulfatarculus sandiegensis TaxID=1429043 RepID=A0A0D2J5G8_9BACT|nr:shikimate kinase [Dethiosulfatarculus sandiegensis]KIX10936.1 shikimate kinase [Dethiosulfatarculus sandiegensis]